MKIKTSTLLLLAGILSAPGCSMVRSIEQWKCDHWGMCHFGIKPSSTPSRQEANLADGVSASPENIVNCGCSSSTYGIRK